jgi:hypothetical protein
MVSGSKTNANDCLLDDARGNAAKVINGTLQTLLQKGENLDIEDSESVQEWINIVFDQLKSFPSEHRTFRLHCVHTGLDLILISLDKAAEMEPPGIN